MNKEYNWNAQKKDLHKLNMIKLEEKLEELLKIKQKMEINLRMNANSNKRFGYHALGKSHYKFIGGNLKHIRKAIACVKTIIHEKGVDADG